MKLYKTQQGLVFEEDGDYFRLSFSDWDALVNLDPLFDAKIRRRSSTGKTSR